MNGKSKRNNKTLTEFIISIMLYSCDSSHWWGEILLIICYVLSIVSESKSNVSTYKILKKRQSNLSYLLKYGCLSYVSIPDLM